MIIWDQEVRTKGKFCLHLHCENLTFLQKNLSMEPLTVRVLWKKWRVGSVRWLNLLMHNQKDREKPDVVEGLKLGHPESNMPSFPPTGWSYRPALAHMTLTSKYRNKALLEPSLSLVTKTADSSTEMHKRNSPLQHTVMHQKPFSVS